MVQQFATTNIAYTSITYIRIEKEPTRPYNHMYALWRCMLRVFIASKNVDRSHICVVVIYMYLLFRCKRHRSLFVCLQSAVSLSFSLSHTHTDTQFQHIGYFIHHTIGPTTV